MPCFLWWWASMKNVVEILKERGLFDNMTSPDLPEKAKQKADR